MGGRKSKEDKETGEHCIGERKTEPVESPVQPNEPSQWNKSPVSDDERKEAEKIIRSDGFFHGYLSRDDAVQMLEKDGDFLVRETFTIENQLEVVLSVKWEEKTMSLVTSKWKHFPIHVTYAGYFTLNSQFQFETMQDLILFHWEHNEEEIVTYSDCVIINPIERKPWEFLAEDITEMGSELGHGVFGRVFQGILRNRNGEEEKVAIKLCDTYEFGAREDFFREARNLRAAKHPNVCEFIGIATNQSPLKLITRMYDKGQLKRFLMKEGKRLPIRQRVRFGLDASKGLEHICKLGMLHLDICVRNCLVKTDQETGITGELGAVISDFGLSQKTEVHNLGENESLPRRWVAPELLGEGKLQATVKSDVWSFGILLWEIFSNGEAPYPELSDDTFLHFYLTAQNKRMRARPNTPVIVKKLMAECWKEEPLHRPSFTESRNQLESCYENLKEQP